MIKKTKKNSKNFLGVKERLPNKDSQNWEEATIQKG
jgi:uncharacterized lipoprotein YehR (DUF1307 family)